MKMQLASYRRKAILLLFGLISAQVARASISFNNTVQSGNQAFSGSLGMDFDVWAPGGINIITVGSFDSASDGFQNGITVAIFDRVTGLPAGGTFLLTSANTD